MVKRNVRLSSPEIGGLWGVYIQETMSTCLLKYFLHHVQDEEIKPILQKSLRISQTHLNQIRDIFFEENIPLPDGFTEKDINLSAPPLFYDLFALSFVYSMNRMAMVNLGFATSTVARADVLNFFTKALNQATELYAESTTLMLSKGIYDRPPMITYPKKVEYVKKQSYIVAAMGKKRPLNAVELTEIFFNIERNYFSVLLCMGLLQVIKDKEIKNYIKDGMEISKKQINFFNDLLKKEELLGTVPVSMEVTTSTVSPFSDKLIVALFHFLNSIDVTLIGHALSLSMRLDLATYYSKVIGEILMYAGKGFNIMVNREWLEQPPQAPNRKALKGM
jgi:spore coat protein CotF